MSDHFDVVVIGGGPGGYSAALYGASAGLNVALVEKDALGGTCLNRGCIPAKAFLETAAVKRHVDHAADFGIESGGEASVNFARTQERKQGIVATLVGGIASMCKGRKVEVFNGVGALGAGRTVNVAMNDGGSATITGDAVILAAGSVPRLIPNFERGGPIMTSDEVLDLSEVPSRVAVIGGGAIGCEFASTFADLGAEVTILEGLPKILPGLDKDVAKVVERSFKKKKINIKTGVMVNGHTPNDSGGTTVSFGDGESVEVDAVVVSVGRRPFSDQLGLEGTQVVVSDRGFVEVDEYCQTGEPGVYAVGDLINTPQLAHVGYAEAILVIKHILGESPMPVMYDRVPWAIYCHPEVAWAGPDEQQAKDAGHDVVVAKHPFKFNSRAMIVGETEGLVKIIAKKNADGSAGQILGVHMVGPWVTEQLSGGYLAVNWEASVDEVAEFIQPHPSLSELFGETVLSLTGRNFNG
ncbi:dihydrolipoyl dehydrogenase [Ilumatobacter coccineus]|uniref:Dihydrolipoyl dehydrogenase n=1 Tax=Ilumatobacter coccineus (strain NBRC 103263 / KCTC 29153 / YM16-304) TaxID=1313172 RepID=A0A6C7EA72_ILUCY|nr:dihydrolipoyl dehydrogenase [Ilumatobacter coccineus]BAN03280.1 dihydrolipoamide dehydrogenase [Ilumatobacter coccineus YM16-304]